MYKVKIKDTFKWVLQKKGKWHYHFFVCWTNHSVSTVKKSPQVSILKTVCSVYRWELVACTAHDSDTHRWMKMICGKYLAFCKWLANEIPLREVFLKVWHEGIIFFYLKKSSGNTVKTYNLSYGTTFRQGFGSGSPWITINLSCWIRIRIQIADLDPGGQKLPTKIEKSPEFSCF